MLRKCAYIFIEFFLYPRIPALGGKNTPPVQETGIPFFFGIKAEPATRVTAAWRADCLISKTTE
jgi:hypothetical protein